MIFALDYDDTYTEGPELWSAFIELAEKAGHQVICVSGRRDVIENRQELNEGLKGRIPIYLSYDMPKRRYMKEIHNIEVDVWIDDKPGLI